MLKTTSQTAFCRSCGCTHSLPHEPALAAAKKLMTDIDRELRTDALYGDARGKMFGVLVCRTAGGKERTLKAFSGQYEGQWEIEGWVPPLFDVQAFNGLNTPMEKEIKGLSRQLDDEQLSSSTRAQIKQERKQLSRQLMKDIHDLYRLHNFHKEQCALSDLFPNGSGIATGTGDCCAPKLLNHAARHNLHPLGLAEFYWGRTNKSDTRHEGYFYPACADKCQPILGFLLCGIE